MITGFNTDVEHDGVVYHVQTEDKGVKSPLILSLVYVGGTILASKRTPYADLIASGLDEKILAERLQRQHRLICAAIHTGRIEDLKRQTERDSVQRAQPRETAEKAEHIESAHEPAVKRAAPPEIVPQHVAPPLVVSPLTAPKEPAPLEAAPHDAVPQPAAPQGAAPQDAAPHAPDAEEAAPQEDEFIFELGSIADTMAPSAFATPQAPTVEPSPPVYDPQVPVHAPPASANAQEPLVPSTDSAPPPEEFGHVDYSRVVDYSSDAERNLRELHISLVEEMKFVAGEFVKVQLHVGRGWDGHRSVAGAAVTLKVLGSSFRPMIFSGKTIADGTAVFYAMLPYFTSGRAAILISASDEGEKAELRRVIHQS